MPVIAVSNRADALDALETLMSRDEAEEWMGVCGGTPTDPTGYGPALNLFKGESVIVNMLDDDPLVLCPKRK